MIPLSVNIRHDISDCCLCGNHTAPDATVYLQLTHDEIDAGASRSRSIKGPVCIKCEWEWRNLERKMGRDVSGDEFLLWVLALSPKKQKRFFREVAALDSVEIRGWIFADIAGAILREAGHDVGIICDCCGEKCRVEQNETKT